MNGWTSLTPAPICRISFVLGIAYSLRFCCTSPSSATETLMMEKRAPFPSHLLISAARVIGTNRGARTVRIRLERVD
ncbi:hypothetical protein TNCT_728891 [Trichonephila clavata]|uniref:Secreted protein n=1 Tax=Trichonephila clavata TaxID=2740835 RepID=A0A8X6G779_TRICU|nr:hypothetical protein TNCT_728891 [Trichonephila clavata]